MIRIKTINTLVSRVIALLMIMLLPNVAISGDAGGPQALFVNLTNKVVIEKFTEMCAYKVSHTEDYHEFRNFDLYFRGHNKGITDELVKQAVFKNDKKAIKRLDKLMQYYSNDLDGIIVYDEEKGARFSLIERGSYTVRHAKIQERRDPKSVCAAFTSVLPVVTRSEL